jgi:hypothetical protein
VKQKPLFSPLDGRRTITLGELSRLTSIPTRTLREWTVGGRIPGAFQTAKGKGNRWRFFREHLESWWNDLQKVTTATSLHK